MIQTQQNSRHRRATYQTQAHEGKPQTTLDPFASRQQALVQSQRQKTAAAVRSCVVVVDDDDVAAAAGAVVGTVAVVVVVAAVFQLHHATLEGGPMPLAAGS